MQLNSSFILGSSADERCTNSTKLAIKDIDKLLFSCQVMEYQCSYFPGLDREYSFANRRGSAWGHRSGEEIRNSISPVWLTVLVTIILAVLYWCVRFFTQVTSASEGRNDCQVELSY